ncbi:MAG TPA: AAA family ATPase, partial [Opitutaceae bacterium]|nr:AAA family ATPase [Opitutaceae bacterium]
MRLLGPIRWMARAFSAPEKRASKPHFADLRPALFGRSTELNEVTDRARHACEVTAVYGRPLMGKSAFLIETARRLEGTGYLVGLYEARGDTDDILLRAVSDLYVSWLYKATYSQQLKSLIRQRRDYLAGLAEAVGSLFEATSKMLPLEELSSMATLALKGLVAAKKDLATGGLALPTLGYDQAKDLIRLLREVTGRPVVLVLDGLETIQHSADLLSSQRTFLNAFLKHPSDWPGVHIFLGVRVESLQQEIGAFLSSLEPASSVQLRELPLMELGEPAERTRLLDYIRAHVPATAQVPDDSLLDMVGGYPGVLFQWLKAVPDTPGELARLAED